MTDAKNFKEPKIPKGAAKAFFEAMTAMNDGNAPTRRKAPTKKKAPAKKSK